MEHSTAILEDANRTVEAAVQSSAPPKSSNLPSDQPDDQKSSRTWGGQRGGKRKNESSHRGSHRGGRGGRNDSKRHKKGDMGRGEYFATQPDKRKRNEEANAKRERDGGRVPGQGVQFSKEEIDAEERRPKHKVAVLIGYSGTGYKGMQISGSEKTIEGDLFKAFVNAGAISKANAEDPKKSSLVRCARTDKGVHAAGNMISLKLIVEDKDIIEKINAELSPQIRVWGIERTIGSFSCYQSCDSRWYEYLIPTHAFLPPHPSSWLAKQIEEFAGQGAMYEAHKTRQAEVEGFWEKIDEGEIKNILDTIDEDIRWEVVKALQGEEEASAKAVKADADVEQTHKSGKTSRAERDRSVGAKSEDAVFMLNATEPQPGNATNPESLERGEVSDEAIPATTTDTGSEHFQKLVQGDGSNRADAPKTLVPGTSTPTEAAITGNRPTNQVSASEIERVQRLRAATKRLRAAYTEAKRRYRISPQRIGRIQEALNKFLGTKNYHNYTVQKTFKDPSANRHIKSFVVNSTPILIGEEDAPLKSEWLSLKVHGQSFMMHQIRKMIGMITLMVRSGADLSTMDASFTDARFSIPKVPGLGLLLERPVFDSYNNLQAVKHDRPKLLFSKYDEDLQAFKEKEIYQRIFREEEERNEFGRFFNHVDNFKEPYFLFVTGKGVEATKGIERKSGPMPTLEGESDGDDGEEG